MHCTVARASLCGSRPARSSALCVLSAKDCPSECPVLDAVPSRQRQVETTESSSPRSSSGESPLRCRLVSVMVPTVHPSLQYTHSSTSHAHSAASWALCWKRCVSLTSQTRDLKSPARTSRPSRISGRPVCTPNVGARRPERAVGLALSSICVSLGEGIAKTSLRLNGVSPNNGISSTSRTDGSRGGAETRGERAARSGRTPRIMRTLRPTQVAI